MIKTGGGTHTWVFWVSALGITFVAIVGIVEFMIPDATVRRMLLLASLGTLIIWLVIATSATVAGRHLFAKLLARQHPTGLPSRAPERADLTTYPR